MITKQERFAMRKTRVHKRLLEAGPRWPRLSVYRSLKYIYAQVVDDTKGVTVAFASSLEKDLRAKFKSGKNVDAAKAVGELVAQRAKQAGVEQVCFDRGGRIYHGRVKAVAEGARQAGLKF